MNSKQDLIQYIMEENEFYRHIKWYLTEVCGHDLSNDTIVCTNEYKACVYNSQYGTHSIQSMIELIARKEGKKIEYRD